MSNKLRLKVILPAARIPEGKIITKVTGTKQYTILSSIKIHSADSASIQSSEVKAVEGVKFLVDRKGSFTAIPDTLELLTELDIDEIHKLIGPRLDYRDEYDR